MAITTKTVTTTTDVAFECDILFKEIKEDEVYTQYRNRCVSKEAVSRLPKTISDSKTLIEYVMMGSGTRTQGFLPEMLKEGIWVLTKCSSDYICQLTNDKDCGPEGFYSHQNFKKPNKFTNVEDAYNWISERVKYGYQYWIFENGEIVEHLKTKLRLINANELCGGDTVE